MEKLKYIIDERGNFAIFSSLATHRSVAQGFDTHNKIVGAGFCNIRHGFYQPEFEGRAINVHCWGESISLGIESRKEDEIIINKQLNND